jgi:hypothetical protein
VCVTIPVLQRIIPLRSMLRSARDTRLSNAYAAGAASILPDMNALRATGHARVPEVPSSQRGLAC